MTQPIDMTQPLGASQSGERDYLFLHPTQTIFENLPRPGDAVKSVAISGNGHEILFKSGRRVFVRGDCTEIAARTVDALVERDGLTPDGHAPNSVRDFSEVTIRRHHEIRREARLRAYKRREDIDAVIAWAKEEFSGAVIDEKTYPEIQAMLEQRFSRVLGHDVVLAMNFYAGSPPGAYAPDHPGFPPMFTYPAFLAPVFEGRPQVDRSPKRHRKLEGDELEHSVALQMHELGDEMMYRPLDEKFIWDLHAELCRILQPLVEEDLKPRLHVRVSADRTKPDVIYPADVKAKLDVILSKWGDPRTSGARVDSRGPEPARHQVTEEFKNMLRARIVTFHEVSAIVGSDGKGSPWSVPLSRLCECQPDRGNPLRAAVGYLEDENSDRVIWQTVYESAEEVTKTVQLAFEEVEKEFFEAHGVKSAGGVDMTRPLEDLAKEITDG